MAQQARVNSESFSVDRMVSELERVYASVAEAAASQKDNRPDPLSLADNTPK